MPRCGNINRDLRAATTQDQHNHNPVGPLRAAALAGLLVVHPGNGAQPGQAQNGVAANVARPHHDAGQALPPQLPR